MKYLKILLGIIITLFIISCGTRSKVKTNTQIHTEIIKDTITMKIYVPIPVDSNSIELTDSIKTGLINSNKAIKDSLKILEDKNINSELRLKSARSLMNELIVKNNKMIGLTDSLNNELLKKDSILQEVNFEYDKVVNTVQSTTTIKEPREFFSFSTKLAIMITVLLAVILFIIFKYVK